VESVQGVSMLLVEDEQEARDLLAAVLERKYPNIRLYLAGNGKRGLEFFRERLPEIVITDISLPQMDGIQMANEIRLLNQATQIIAITAHNLDPSLASSSICHYLKKPLVYSDLFSIIDKCIAG
jgi:YesN/AraC family two-component response regulator